MIRPSDAVFIIKKDFETGLVHKVDSTDIIEYWIYQSKDSAMINDKGALIEGQKTGDKSLRCIVVCENSPKHLKKDHENHIVVSGVIFAEKDMEDYLGKTGRSV